MLLPESYTSPSSSIMEHLQQQDLHAAQPMSRTHQYRKVMKPLLERKRRARINKCLDELKDLMVSALQTEGESITKLEKADVLELTVRHLRKLKKHNALGLTPQATYAGRFKAGYTHCAQEVSRFMTAAPVSVDVQVSTRLLSHLNGCIQALDEAPPSTIASTTSTPISSPTLAPKASATPELPMEEEPAHQSEDQALDLSSKRRRSDSPIPRSSTSSSSSSRQRQLSDDSDDSGVGVKSGAPSNDDKNSWRPW